MQTLLGGTAVLVSALIIAVLALREARIRGALVTGFVARTILALANAYAISLPGAGGDALSFERAAADWAAMGKQYIAQNFATGTQMYPWLVSLMYWIADRSPLLAAQANVLFGTLVVWNVYRIVRELVEDPRWAIRAAWITALFPTLVLFSSMTLREVAVVYPFTLGTYYFVRWMNGRSIANFIAGLTLLVVSAAFHAGMIGAVAALGAAIVASWITSLWKGRTRTWLRVSVAMIPFAAGGAGVLATGAGLEKLRPVAEMGFEAVALQQQMAARDRAAYLQGLQMHSVQDAVWQLPIRVFYFLFTPLPWMVRSAGDLVGLLDAIMYAALIYAIWRGLRRVQELDTYGTLFVMVAGSTILFAVGTSNYGTSIRHRAKLAPVLIVLAVAASAERARPSRASLGVDAVEP